MIEPRRDLDLGEELLRPEHCAELGTEHLESNPTPSFRSSPGA